MGQTYGTRIVGGVVGFAFAAVWFAEGLADAVGCLAAAAVGMALTELWRRRSIDAIRQRGGTLRQRAATLTAARPAPRPAPARGRRIKTPDWPSQESKYGW